MKIQSKLILGFLIVSTLAAVLGYLSFLQLKEISSPLNHDIPVSIDKLIHTNDVDTLAQQLRYYREILMQSARNYALTRQKRWSQRYYAFGPELMTAIVRIINKSNETNKSLFQLIDEANKILTATEHTAIRHVNEGRHLRAVELLESEAYWTQKRLYEGGFQDYFLNHGISERSKIMVKLAAQHTRKVLQNSITFTTIFVLVIIFLSILIGVFITRSIAKPLNYLTDCTKRISEGDLFLKITVASNDEIGTLTKAFNKMAQSLNDTINALAEEKASLDHKVVERTSELEQEIVVRKKAEEKLITANKQLKETQTQLVQSTKLASIGELITGITHELNQPLMYIRSNAQLETIEGPEHFNSQSAYETLKIVEEGTDRMMNIINHLRDFARQSDFSFDSVHLNDVLENSLTMFNEQFRLRAISINKDCDEHFPNIWGNANQLEQVFINMISNAIDAMSEREDAMLRIKTEFRPTENGVGDVVVSFTDNGLGIPESIQDKIFDPFFTNKEVGEGTGLGLSISYGIVKDHKGDISVSSVEGEGTTFEISLPVIIA